MKKFDVARVPGFIMIGAIVILIGYAVLNMDSFWVRSDTEHTQAIKDAILRAATHCYALEGSYPPDLAYLESKYGLILDHKRFNYVYDAFGSNIRPEVEVLSWNTQPAPQ